MIEHPRKAARLAIAAGACALLAAYAGHAPQRQTDTVDYRSRTPAAAPSEDGSRRLTIQSGEGEKLNLPWFIRDAQDWVNGQ